MIKVLGTSNIIKMTDSFKLKRFIFFSAIILCAAALGAVIGINSSFSKTNQQINLTSYKIVPVMANDDTNSLSRKTCTLTGFKILMNQQLVDTVPAPKEMIRCGKETKEIIKENIILDDFNFDGIMDIAVAKSSENGNRPFLSYFYFVYDKVNKKFVPDQALKLLSLKWSLDFSSSTKIISARNYSNCGWTSVASQEDYHRVGGVLKKIYSMTQTCTEAPPQHVTEHIITWNSEGHIDSDTTRIITNSP